MAVEVVTDTVYNLNTGELETVTESVPHQGLFQNVTTIKASGEAGTSSVQLLQGESLTPSDSQLLFQWKF